MLLNISAYATIKYSQGSKFSANSSHDIVGGTIEDNPPLWMGAMYKSDRRDPKCTAEFITNRWLITAKHCIAKENITSLSIAYTGGALGTSLNKIALVQGVPLNIPGTVYTDIALVKLQQPYPYPVELLPLFHGYSFNPYSIHEEAKIYGYGILGVDENGKNIFNYDSRLIKAYVQPTRFLYDTFALEVIPNNKGFPTTGDSGGPLLVKVFNSNELFKVAGILAEGDDSITDYVVFSSDILQAIANNAQIPIFKYPLDNIFTNFDDDNNLTISGWGPYPSAIKIVALANGVEVANCQSAAFSGDATSWHCKAKFKAAKPEDVGDGVYKAQIINKDGQSGDSVVFKAYVKPNLEIIHPASGEIYTVPQGSTYLIVGEGVPNYKLSYLLENLDDGTSTKDPCINSDSATIAINGEWQCRINADRTQSTNYRINISYESAPTNGDANAISLVSKEYKVNIISTPSVVIIEPTEDELVESDHVVRVKINDLDVNKNLELSIYTPSGVTTHSNALSSTQNEINLLLNIKDIDHSWETTNTVKVLAKVYINQDENPIVESNIKYFSVYYQINFQTVRVNTLFGKLEATFSGMASNNRPIKVTLSPLNSPGQELTSCSARSDGNGNWQCIADIDSLATGQYNAVATLYKDDSLAETGALAKQAFQIAGTQNVEIRDPCCCNRCTITKF